MSTIITPFAQPHGYVHLVQCSSGEDYILESDGRPMSETDLHRKLLIALLHALEEFYRNDPKVYVSGNIFVYYRDESGKMQQISPDILVVFGVDKKERRTYNIEDEGQAPEVVFELTSNSTKVEDFFTKRYIYAALGVKEYFIYDPYSETGQHALQGFRLESGEYVPIKEIRQKNAAGLHSNILRLELHEAQGGLRLYNPKTGVYLRAPEETEAALQAAEAEVARLRDELARLRGLQS
jgi:Uma2 family endonuclease